mmetsp:Transcript_5363/g.13231  ORF Transcript_5363/g.13231 Transcript_5363/m.13231 type:complete len:204 (-) Transcript_5363:788-1399(-)
MVQQGRPTDPKTVMAHPPLKCGQMKCDQAANVIHACTFLMQTIAPVHTYLSPVPCGHACCFLIWSSRASFQQLHAPATATSHTGPHRCAYTTLLSHTAHQCQPVPCAQPYTCHPPNPQHTSVCEFALTQYQPPRTGRPLIRLTPRQHTHEPQASKWGHGKKGTKESRVMPSQPAKQGVHQALSSSHGSSQLRQAAPSSGHHAG